MLPLYETLVADSILDTDRSVLDSMRAKIDEELKKLDEKWVNSLSITEFWGCKKKGSSNSALWKNFRLLNLRSVKFEIYKVLGC